MEETNKWQKIKISFERICIEKETEKAYLFKFEIGLLEEYKFWYPKALVKILYGDAVISYVGTDFPKKIFFKRTKETKELVLKMSELINLLEKSSYSFCDDIERLEIYIPEKVFKEVEIDEELFA